MSVFNFITTQSPFKAIYFHHIGKTGGTSLNHILAKFFLRKDRYRFGGATSELFSRRFRYISGHMPWQVRELLEAPSLTITLVRDPIEQVISTFRHLQRQPDHIFTLSATSLSPGFSLDEFLMDNGVRKYLQNTQTLSIARRFEWDRFASLCFLNENPRWSEKAKVTDPNFVLLYGDPTEERTDYNLLQRAIQNLQGAPTIFSTTENLDDNIQRIVRVATGKNILIENTRRNVASNLKVEINLKQRKEIEKLVELDVSLYDFVRSNSLPL